MTNRMVVVSNRVAPVNEGRAAAGGLAVAVLAALRRSGGIFRDMMIHDLDQMRFLLGEALTGVFARGEVMVDPALAEAQDHDSATAVFWAASGATVVIQNCRRATYGFDQRVEIFGSRGTVAMDNVPLTQTSVADASGYHAPKLPEHFPERYAEAYRREIAAFVDAVATGREPEPTADDGMQSLILANAATESARTGRVVAIPDARAHR